MQLFESYAHLVLSEMAKVRVSDLANWPLYQHQDFTGKGEQVKKRYAADVAAEKIQEYIQKAVLAISQDSSISEVESEDLAAALSKAMNKQSGGMFGGTSADALSKRAVSQLLDALKGQTPAVKTQVAQVVAVAAKQAEDKPEQAQEIAAKGAEVAADIVAQNEPENTQQEPGNSSIEQATPRANVLDKEFEVTPGLYKLLLDDIQNFNKKNQKLSIEPVEIEYIGERQTKGAKPDQTFTLIKFKVKVPKLTVGAAQGEEYKYIGKIDHKQGNLLSMAPNTGKEQEVIAHARKADARDCKCGKRLERSKTYIIENPVGKLEQVGGTCLQKYIPGANEAKITRLIQYLEELTRDIMGYVTRSESGEGGDRDEFGGGGSRGGMYNIKDALTLGIIITLKNPFRSKNMGGYTTAEQIMDAFSGQIQDKLRKSPKDQELLNVANAMLSYSENKDSYKEEVEKLIQWGLEKFKPKEAESSYAYNMVNLLNRVNEGYIDEKKLPLLVSVLSGYISSRKTPEQESSKVSSFLGQPGQIIGDVKNYKIKNQKDKVAMRGVDLNQYPYSKPIKAKIINYRSFSSDFGLKNFYEAEDEEGNLLSWTARGGGLEDDQVIKVRNGGLNIIINNAKVVGHRRSLGVVQLRNLKFEGSNETYASKKPIYISSKDAENRFRGQMPPPENKEQAIELLNQYGVPWKVGEYDSYSNIYRGSGKLVNCDLAWFKKPANYTELKNTGQGNAVDFFIDDKESQEPANESFTFASYYATLNS